MVSTTTYDLFGRPLVVGDAKGTQTNTYDAVTGRLKQIVDSQAGTISATYDADGHTLTKTLPNGMRAPTPMTRRRSHTIWTGSRRRAARPIAPGCTSAMKRSIFGQARRTGRCRSADHSYDGVGPA